MVIDINGKTIHYERKGRGETILFVHGWGGTLNSLRALAELAASQYDVIILDLPGFGKSSNPDANWGVEEYANCVLEFIETLHLNNLTYFGHSFGGGLGIIIASTHKRTIKKLILCNSAFKRRNKQSRTVKFLKKYLYPYIPFLQKFEAKLRYLIYRVFFPHSDLIQYPHLEPNFRKVMTQDLTHYASEINVPTLILWGEADTYTPVSYAYELNKNIHNSQLKIWPEKRHNLPLRHPDLVWQEMSHFLKKNL